MSLILHPEEPSRPERIKDKALKIARKYVDLSYSAAVSRIKEETPCSKSSAHKALKAAQKEKPAAAKEPTATEPTVTILKEEEKKPAYIEAPAKTETLEGLEEIPQAPLVQKVLAEGELTPEDLQSLFEAANDAIGTINEKRRPSDKSAKILGKLWYKPFNAWWTSISEKNPLLVIAVLVTVMVYAPSLIGVVIDWRTSRQKTQQKPLPQAQPDKK